MLNIIKGSGLCFHGLLWILQSLWAHLLRIHSQCQFQWLLVHSRSIQHHHTTSLEIKILELYPFLIPCIRYILLPLLMLRLTHHLTIDALLIITQAAIILIPLVHRILRKRHPMISGKIAMKEVMTLVMLPLSWSLRLLDLLCLPRIQKQRRIRFKFHFLLGLELLLAATTLI